MEVNILQEEYKTKITSFNPPAACNYASGDQRRVERFVSLARIAILSFSAFCIVLFWFFAKPITGGAPAHRPLASNPALS